MVLTVVLLLLVPLLLPAFVGLFYMFRSSRVRKLTGWFTFKPVIATPLFVYLYLAIGGSQTPLSYLSLIPGLALTLLILLVFHDLLRSRQFIPLILVLIVLDFIRWGSAVLSVVFADYTFCLGPNCPQSTWGPLLLLFTLAFPSVYAIVVMVLNIIFPKESNLTIPIESVSPPV